MCHTVSSVDCIQPYPFVFWMGRGYTKDTNGIQEGYGWILIDVKATQL